MRLITIVAVVIAFAAGAEVASAAPVQGALSEIGCFQDTTSSSTDCPNNTAPALRDTQGVVVSPDGKNVYELSAQDAAIAEFARNANGTLTSSGCISEAVDTSQCLNRSAVGIFHPRAIAISPDGKNVYVVGEDNNTDGAIAEFARDPLTGQLTQLAPPDSCIGENTNQSGEPSECGNADGHGLLSPDAVTVSPDGKNVYIADSNGEAIAEFTRNGDGTLSQLGGSNDCISEQGFGSTDCGTTTGLGISSLSSLAVSPDGKNLYAGNSGPGAIAEFTRNADGSLTQLGGNNACISEGNSDCGTNEQAVGMGSVADLAVSPDGQNLYSSSENGRDSAVAELARHADGSLTQLPGSNSCIVQTGGAAGCSTSGTGLLGAAQLAVSPDGADVYVATFADDCCMSDVAELARNTDGSLTQLASPDNCIEENRSASDCPTNEAGQLGGGQLAISPDAKNVYASGFDPSGSATGLTELARNPVFHTLTVSLPGAGTGTVSDGTGAISCPSTCSHAYDAISRVTLTATPATGSAFAGWSGAGCSRTGTCQVNMSQDAAVTATFTLTSTPLITAGKPTVHGSSGAGFSGFVNPNNSPTSAFFQYGLDKRYTNPGSTGPQYTQSTPVHFVGSNTGDDLVTASVANLIPNALYHVRLVATNGHGTSFGPDQTFNTLLGPTPPPPTLGKFFNAAPVSGIVYLVLGNKLIPLTENTKIPANAILDTLHGQLSLTSASGGVTLASDAKAKSKKKKGPKTFKGTFGGAVFQVTQAKNGPNKGQTTLSLAEGRAGVPSYKSCKAKHAADAHATLSSRVLQTLRSRASGRYRTRGRYGSGTVRGTKWTTTDRCDGTLIAVQQHSVLVTDFIKHITILVRAGHHYLAKAPTRRHK